MLAEPQTSYDSTTAPADEGVESPVVDEETGAVEEGAGPSDEPEKPKEKEPFYPEDITGNADYDNMRSIQAGLLYGRVVWYRDFWKDYWFLLKNTHVTLGCFLAHKLHEFDRSERLVYLICVIAVQYPVSHYVSINYANAAEWKYYAALAAGSAVMQVYEAFLKFLATCPCLVVNGCCEKKCKYQDGACFCDCECSLCCPRPEKNKTGHEKLLEGTYTCGICNMCSCWPCGCIKSGLDADVIELMEFDPEKHSHIEATACETHCCHSRYIFLTVKDAIERVGSLGMAACLIASFTLFFLAIFDEHESPESEMSTYFEGLLLTWAEALGISFTMYVYTKYSVDDLIIEDPAEHIELNYDAFGGQGPDYPDVEYLDKTDWENTGEGMCTLCLGCFYGDEDEENPAEAEVETAKEEESKEESKDGESAETPAEETALQEEPAAEPEAPPAESAEPPADE